MILSKGTPKLDNLHKAGETEAALGALLDSPQRGLFIWL
jgi:hypothetical protein